MQARFDDRALDRLPRVLGLAEDLTGSYFKISSFDPAHFPFEVATLQTLDQREIAPGAFAHLSRYQVPNLTRPGVGLVRPLYRICLQDHNVLEALQRERGALSLDGLLLYVLAHELCHIVRFCRYEQLYDAGELERADEEARVHRLTHDVLRPLRRADVRSVLERYAGHRWPQ